MRTNQDVIAVVTGANRGIGLEIVRQLADRGVTVVLTARRPDAGAAAAATLAGAALRVTFHPLSVTDEASLRALRDHLAAQFGRLDVLVNNAGMIADTDAGGLDVSLATVRETLETNTLAPLRMAQMLLPLLQQSRAGRIVNMSSGMGALSEMAGGDAAYRISKAAGIAVNAMCPGWVKTDMGSAHAERPVSQGAETAVWLALDAPQDLTGTFVRD